MNLKLARKLHLWLGLLFAPSIIFFSLSGMLQICGLHEDGDHPWIAELALIHKDQMVSAPQRGPRPPEAAAPKPAEGAPRAAPASDRTRARRSRASSC